ncbi:cell death activator CIDE-B [Cygnus atratus]|uniref:cell death activator CIDE-B n=1 Tax=Cygnus atratus TaxID=8868 RepID=UPI0021B8244B|nr:cell death activator CIDE-B [Cygnus atratus]
MGAAILAPAHLSPRSWPRNPPEASPPAAPSAGPAVTGNPPGTPWDSPGTLPGPPSYGRAAAVTFGGQWDPPGARGGDEVARVTVALARAGPRDLVGRLRVTAAVRGLRCDVAGLGPERLLRELLRLLAAMTRAVGQSLLNLSALLRRLLDSAPQRGGAYEH